MKRQFITFTAWILLFGIWPLFAEEETTISPASEAAEGLDLQAVSELFKEFTETHCRIFGYSSFRRPHCYHWN